MALRNCANCGKLFTAPTTTMKLCMECEQEDQKKFDKVKEYIKKHPTATVIEITKETGVERKQLYEWVRSGRLDVAGVENLGLRCEGCGEAITSGRFCIQCAARLQNDAKRLLGGRKSQADPGEKGKAGFHVADSIVRRRRKS
jgi:flagellar operon protein (TIGR03826 family)